MRFCGVNPGLVLHYVSKLKKSGANNTVKLICAPGHDHVAEKQEAGRLVKEWRNKFLIGLETVCGIANKTTKKEITARPLEENPTADET